MDISTKEDLMDKLLVFMNAEIEKHGAMLNGVYFRLTEDGEDAIQFMEQHQVPYEQLNIVLNTCISRQYVRGHHNSLRLSDDGQGRAISIERAKHNPPSTTSGDIHISELHAHGPSQIGNHNTQNIENIFTTIISQIDEADATEDVKQEAKGLLSKFLEHPLTGTAIGLAPTAIQSILGGA